MQNVLNVMAWILAVSLSAILFYLVLELCVGLARMNERNLEFSSRKSVGAILVPAHNEALSISGTVSALRVAAPHCRIVVVADNCTDETANLARASGAEAICRTSQTQKGKGFALAFGRDYLAKEPPDAVIVVDADCELSPGGADILISRAVKDNQPVQGVYLLTADVTAAPLTLISNFAVLIKNVVRARGLERLAGGTLLFGSGMAFPWKMFATLDLASSHAVEDLELGLSLARVGIRISFENGATVTSPAVSGASSASQRSRWEHGFLETSIRQTIPLFYMGILKRSKHLLLVAAHMMVPPLAVLTILYLVALILMATLCWMKFISLKPLMLLSTGVFLLMAALFAAWWKEGRAVISGGTLLKIPLYVLWKVPIYLRFFTARQTAWNRTQRDGEQL